MIARFRGLTVADEAATDHGIERGCQFVSVRACLARKRRPRSRLAHRLLQNRCRGSVTAKVARQDAQSRSSTRRVTSAGTCSHACPARFGVVPRKPLRQAAAETRTSSPQTTYRKPPPLRGFSVAGL